MSSRHNRELRKTQLLNDIRCQRAEIRQISDEWTRRMQPVDTLWQSLYRLRAPVMLCGGLLLLRGLKRKPGRLPLYVRRAAGIWGTLRFIRRKFIPVKRVR